MKSYTISKKTPIAVLTVSQFIELLDQRDSESEIEQTNSEPKDYTQGFVYGLKGIRGLFGVSHTTAQRYKDTFLQPAVRQNGRKIVVDKAMALELFDEYSKKRRA